MKMNSNITKHSRNQYLMIERWNRKSVYRQLNYDVGVQVLFNDSDVWILHVRGKDNVFFDGPPSPALFGLE